MDAQKATLFQLVDGSKQFRIPIYQRAYSWKQEQCIRILNDILKIAYAPPGASHFLGSIVYVADGNFMLAGVNALLVIDGQQRLTTLSLILLALRQLVSDGNDIGATAQRIGNLYIFNSNEEESSDGYIKLGLTRSDKNTYRKICLGVPLGPEDDNRIQANYRYFLEELKSDHADPRIAYAGIQRIQLVYIALELGRDDPQLIFESMNSTGLDLAQADLVRNFVLMGLSAPLQEKIYNLHWYPMEGYFGHQYRDRFDSFLRTYLTVRTGSIPREDEVYAAFKKHVLSLPPVEHDVPHRMVTMAADLYEQAGYYASIAFGKERDPELQAAFHDFATLRADVAHPFLIELYSDQSSNLITREELLNLVRLTESYVFRRFLCGIPTNSMNKTFAGLLKGIDKGNKYHSRVQAILLKLTSYRRFPGDAEVVQELVDRDVYNSPRCVYLLERLENSYHPKEPISCTGTIEHVMPQTLTPEWKASLGDEVQSIHERYLHALGNLTLTGYNSELGCLTFREKLTKEEGGFLSNQLSLNKYIRQQTAWGAEQIRDRGKELAERACTVWPAPDAVVLVEFPETKKSADEGIYTLDTYQHLTDSNLALFELFAARILALNPDVHRECKKHYIAFKYETNFVDVVPQATGLVLYLNLKFDQIDDPKGWCEDKSDVGKPGNGDVLLRLTKTAQLDYVMELVKQALDDQIE